MSKELLTIIVDAVVSVAVAAIGIWVVPEYTEFALTAVLALQGVAVGFVGYFAQERKIEQLRATVERVARGR